MVIVIPFGRIRPWEYPFKLKRKKNDYEFFHYPGLEEVKALNKIWDLKRI